MPPASSAASEPIGSVLVRLIRPLYLPAFLISLSSGMLIPILPLYLRETGLSYQSVTAVLAAAGVGGLLSQLPIATAISRVGQWRVVIALTLTLALSVAMLGVTTTTVALAALRLVAGFGRTSWSLSQHSLISLTVTPDVRGRVSSTFGGVVRSAWLVGPLIGGFAAAHFGYTTAFLMTGVVTVTSIVPLLGTYARETMPPAQPRDRRGRLRDVFRQNRRSVVTAGAVFMFIAGAREGRLVVIPLLGAALGLDVASVGILVAVGGASDLLLFPLSGWLMDRFTRLAASVPALSFIAIGLFLAAAASTSTTLMVGAAIAGLGNGMGSGILLTIGADLAPRADAVQFLSMLGLASAAGRVFGPVAVGAVADGIGLAASAALLGMVALAAVGLLIVVLGDTKNAQSTGRPTQAV